MNFLPPIFKNQWFLFISIFIANLCFRVIYIDNHSFWFDECLWVDIGEWETQKIIDFCFNKDPNPPLYPLLIHYWVILFGDTEFAIRMIPAIACSLAGSFLFLLAYRFFNPQTAVFVSLMFFTSNEMFYYAQEARPYALIILFVVLSNYFFLNLIDKPALWKTLLLGAFNCILFYLHLLTAFCFIGQLFLFPFLIQRTKTFTLDGGLLNFNFQFKWKLPIYYFLSWVTFYFVFFPWQSRFIQLIKEGSKNFWLAKPSYTDFKLCIYDFFNSKELYQAHIFSLIAIVLFIIFFKKFRCDNFSFKPIFIALVIGPALIYLNYKMASFSPIFLKRYVLFTILGFMLLYSYIFSLVKIKFNIKLVAFLILSVFSFLAIKIPRPVVFDYKNGVAFLKEVQTDKTLITNDLTDLFSYYYDKEGAWKMKQYDQRVKYLYEKKNVFTPQGIEWPKTMDFSKYSDIYYTCSFEGYSDPGLQVEKYLRANLVFKEDIPWFIGMKILHFTNPNFK